MGTERIDLMTVERRRSRERDRSNARTGNRTTTGTGRERRKYFSSSTPRACLVVVVCVPLCFS